MVRKSTVVALGVLAAVVAVSFLLLHIYKLDLVHTIVVNAVMQKAPPGYPREEIREPFSRARLRAQAGRSEAAYLERLLTISRRLEKIQQLSEKELHRLLADLEQ